MRVSEHRVSDRLKMVLLRIPSLCMAVVRGEEEEEREFKGAWLCYWSFLW